MASNDSIRKTLLVAIALCFVCSLVVSGAAVLLKPAQVANKALDRKTNILAAAGLLQDGVDIEEQFQQVEARIVDLDTGMFTDEFDADGFDQRRIAKTPDLATELSDEQDVAKISRRENYAIVYLVKSEGMLDKVILPVHGYGLWSTLYGFLALENDANTVAGLGFYEHGETPGLGGEVDNPNWKAIWPGKKIYQGNDVALHLIKGSVDTSSADAAYMVDGLSGATLTSKGVTNLIHFWLGQMGYQKFLANLRAGEV